MSDHEAEREGSIKVTDRRLFDAEGRRRTDVEESGPTARDSSALNIDVSGSRPQGQRQTPTADKHRPPASAQTSPPPADTSSASRRSTDPRARHPGSSGVVDPSGREPLTFTAFLESLFVQAMMQLGAVRTPDGRVPEPDVNAAQDTIDILGLLQEKTEGNLSPEERRFFDDILYELRMTYLAVTQRLAGVAAQQAGTKRG